MTSEAPRRSGRPQVAAPARLLAVFLVLSAIPLAALGWLGWHWLEQEGSREADRVQRVLDNAAALLVRELDRSLAAWDQLLLAGLQPSRVSPATEPTLPNDVALLVFDARGVVRRQGVSLPYYPAVPAPGEAPGDVFAAAEAFEFREGNLEAAASAYRRLADTTDRRVRAEALKRLARTQRRQQKTRDALAAYGELATLTDARVFGSGDPAELLARRERITFFNAAGSERAVKDETALLMAALSEGRFLIDRATFEFYSESVAPAPSTSSLRLAEAVAALWPVWLDEASGRRTWNQEGERLVTIWRRGSSESGTRAAIVGGLDNLVSPVNAVARGLQVELTLDHHDAQQQAAVGSLPEVVAPPGSLEAVRTAQETKLPWTLRVSPADPVVGTAAVRRSLIAAGFGLMVLVVGAAGYFVFRAVSRELGVARLQSDFVATVSHEFRTPLTAMRHLTEMLEEGGVSSDRLAHYYDALGKETRRLHETVENLLDFGRIEAGRQTYHMEDVNVLGLASAVVDDLREQRTLTPQRLECNAAPKATEGERELSVSVRADRDALTLALRNLIDNAIEYSPDSSTVSVSVDCRNGRAGICVEDRGAGIPPHEQRQIFRKFVRGTTAKTLNVKGTGLGLAMAAEIVRAHGGSLELASKPGSGSRFTILLPREDVRTFRAFRTFHT